MIRLRLEPIPLDRADSFVGITAFAEEEIPLRGQAGRLDWLLGGEGNRLILDKRLNGAHRSQALLSSKRRVLPRYILFAGLGKRKSLTGKRLSNRVEDIVRGMLKASVQDMAMNVFAANGKKTNYEAEAAETLNGALRAMAGHPVDVSLAICEPDPKRFQELVLVAERAVFRPLEGRDIALEIDI